MGEVIQYECGNLPDFETKVEAQACIVSYGVWKGASEMTRYYQNRMGLVEKIVFQMELRSKLDPEQYFMEAFRVFDQDGK